MKLKKSKNNDTNRQKYKIKTQILEEQSQKIKLMSDSQKVSMR